MSTSPCRSGAPRRIPLGLPSPWRCASRHRSHGGELNEYLREHKVETRYLFAGNILQQPGYRHIEHRVATPLTETDRVLKTAFFIGVYPGMDEARLGYMLQVFEDFMKEHA